MPTNWDAPGGILHISGQVGPFHDSRHHGEQNRKDAVEVAHPYRPTSSCVHRAGALHGHTPTLARRRVEIVWHCVVAEMLWKLSAGSELRPSLCVVAVKAVRHQEADEGPQDRRKLDLNR